MARKLIIYSGVIVALLVIGGGGLYAYNYVTTDTPPTFVPQNITDSQPDSSVLAGPVQKSSATSITITKQDGAEITLGITASTRLFIESASSTTHVATIKDLMVGKVVLITPTASDPSVAESISIVAPPPTAPSK